uniref:Uncharacterized protein n=1 Tax=Arundo donax TaxID=35708 RepID=A0A0A9B356_ARUDO
MKTSVLPLLILPFIFAKTTKWNQHVCSPSNLTITTS